MIQKTYSIKSGMPCHISSIADEVLKDKQPAPDGGGGEGDTPPQPQPQPQAKETAATLAQFIDSLEMTAPIVKERRPSITRIMSGDDWCKYASVVTEQKQLCGPLWYEGEICILFADTNVGKSILAVQIADLVSKGAYGENTALPEFTPETLPQTVVYADFELSLAQFGRRYSVELDGENKGKRAYYPFGPRFNRLELYYDLNEEISEEFASRSFADQIISDLEMRVEETRASVLIIDNITFMAAGTETAADAMPLMKKLVALKKRRNLSILLLAHTPKRCLSNPLTRNDLQGSKMLINFADSAFAIGESSIGKNIRYIKQIKQRNCEQVYDSDNVLECRIGNIYENFLGFTSIGTGPEDKHLAERASAKRSSDAAQAREMKESGMSIDRICSALGISRATAFRLLAKQVKN